MTDQLPAAIQPAALTTRTDIHVVPVLIVDAGDQASWRYVEFFTANIRNPNTRRAYARACARPRGAAAEGAAGRDPAGRSG